MEKEKLKRIITKLKMLVEQLESEVYSDPKAYTQIEYQQKAPILDYEEVLDDDGYPD